MKAVILAGGLGSRLSQETVLKPVDEGHLLTYHRDNFWHTWTVYEIARRWRQMLPPRKIWQISDDKQQRSKDRSSPVIAISREWDDQDHQHRFNEEAVIVRAMIQFKAPSPGYRQHLFCDNASTDGTVDILRTRREPNVRK